MGILLPIAIVMTAVVAACGVAPSGRKDAGGPDEDGGTGPTPGPDGSPPGPDAGPDRVDGGTPDAGLITHREGITERWAAFNEELVDLKIIGRRLFALLKGKPNRLVDCPISHEIRSPDCLDFVDLSKAPYDSNNNKFFEVAPLLHNNISDDFSVVTFTTQPNNYPGFYLIDRRFRQITDQKAFPFQIRVGSDVLPGPQFPFGAILLGASLFVATRTGGVFGFSWNGDGTVGANIEGGIPVVVPASHFGSNRFVKKDGRSAWLLNNGSPLAPRSSLDVLQIEDDGRAHIDLAQNHEIGSFVLETLNHLAMSPDQGKIVVASAAGVFIVELATGRILDRTEIEASPVRAIQWYSRDGQDKLFVTARPNKIFTVPLRAGRFGAVSAPLPVYGEEAGASALDVSECIFYQGLKLSGGRSAITAVRCEVLMASP